MPMNWDDLRIVLAVSRARTFQGAARLLQLTHTTVGRRIAALERRFGAPMFLRENNVCVPTATCARLITAAARMEREVLSARSSLDDRTAQATGPVRLVSVPWVLNEVLLPAIPDLHGTHGGLGLRLHGSLDDTPLPADEPVIALRFELPPGRGDTVIPLARIGYAVYGPAGRAGQAGLPWVSFGGSMPLDWLRAQQVADDDLILTVNDGAAVRAAVRAGIGKGLMPECLAEGDPTLVRISPPTAEFSRILRAVGRVEDLLGPRGAPVLEWVERCFADLGCGLALSQADGPGTRSGSHGRS